MNELSFDSFPNCNSQALWISTVFDSNHNNIQFANMQMSGNPAVSLCCMLLQPRSWPIAVLSPEHTHTVIIGGQGPAEGPRRAQAADTSVRHWGTRDGGWAPEGNMSFQLCARPAWHAGICCQIHQAFCCWSALSSHVVCRCIFMLSDFQSFVHTLNWRIFVLL